MDELLIRTGLIGDNKVVMDFLIANNINRVSELNNYDVDMLKERYLKDMLRGIKDLIAFKYSFIPLPFDTYLRTNIKFTYNENAYLTVDFGDIDFHRMGLSLSEKLELKAWAKQKCNEEKLTEISFIDLLRSYVKDGKDEVIKGKLSVYVEYYDYNKRMTSGENTMNKFFYLRGKLDVVNEKLYDIGTKREGLKGDLNESRRTY